MQNKWLLSIGKNKMSDPEFSASGIEESLQTEVPASTSQIKLSTTNPLPEQPDDSTTQLVPDQEGVSSSVEASQSASGREKEEKSKKVTFFESPSIDKGSSTPDAESSVWSREKRKPTPKKVAKKPADQNPEIPNFDFDLGQLFQDLQEDGNESITLYRGDEQLDDTVTQHDENLDAGEIMHLSSKKVEDIPDDKDFQTQTSEKCHLEDCDCIECFTVNLSMLASVASKDEEKKKAKEQETKTMPRKGKGKRAQKRRKDVCPVADHQKLKEYRSESETKSGISPSAKRDKLSPNQKITKKEVGCAINHAIQEIRAHAIVTIIDQRTSDLNPLTTYQMPQFSWPSTSQDIKIEPQPTTLSGVPKVKFNIVAGKSPYSYETFEESQHTSTTKTPKQFKCTQCSCEYKYRRSLRRHVAEKHPPDDEGFTCLHCDRKFRLKSICLSHMSTHQNNKHDLLPQAQVHANCPYCKVQFTEYNPLIEHIINHKPPTCPMCDEKVDDMNLRDHLRSHKAYSTRPIKCECGQKFESPRLLARHQAGSRCSSRKKKKC